MTRVHPANFAPATDHDLLTTFAENGHESAFAEVVQRHGGMVLSVCRSVLGNTSDAEDAAQAVFLTLARKAHSSSVRFHLVGWLHRVAWYVSARGAAARAVRRRHEQEASRLRDEFRQADPDPIQLDMLHAGLAELPEKYRVALILHHLEGRSHAETAALTGCSVDAVAVRLHRGREMLRKRFKQKNVAVSAALLGGLWLTPGSVSASPAFVATSAKAAAASLAGPLTSTALVSGPTLALSKGAIDMLFYANLKSVVVVLAGLLLAVGVAGTAFAIHSAHLPPANAAIPVAIAPAVAAAPAVAPPADVDTPQANEPAQATTGVLVHVTQESISIQQRKGAPVTVTLNAATVVRIDDVVATAGGLKEGMSVAAFHQAGEPAIEIRAYTKIPPVPRK